MFGSEDISSKYLHTTEGLPSDLVRAIQEVLRVLAGCVQGSSTYYNSVSNKTDFDICTCLCQKNRAHAVKSRASRMFLLLTAVDALNNWRSLAIATACTMYSQPTLSDPFIQ